MKALVVGESVGLMMALPSLLSRAGFLVDVVSTRPIFRKAKFVNHFFQTKNIDALISEAVSICENNYSLIVIGDDVTLKKIKESAIPNEKKLKLLPVVGSQHFQHVASRIGLSVVLKESGINTPKFRVANSFVEIRDAADELEFPFFVKMDFLRSESNVFECCSAIDLENLKSKNLIFPVLLQEKISGVLLDLSGVFLETNLVHFAYAVTHEFYGNELGAGKLRDYFQLSVLGSDVFCEMRALGKALGAHGFVNITCIISAVDHKRYYIEADMRPTVWVEFPKYCGDDPAKRILEYFKFGKVLLDPYEHNFDFPEKVTLPFYYRLSFWEFFLNKNQVWKYCSNHFGWGFFWSRYTIGWRRFLSNFFGKRLPYRQYQFFKSIYKKYIYRLD